MNFYKTTNPDDYGLYFYKQIGLNCTFEQPHEQIWTNPDVGTIHIYGSLDEIQCGTGDYTIPADLLAEFAYSMIYGIKNEKHTKQYPKRANCDTMNPISKM